MEVTVSTTLTTTMAMLVTKPPSLHTTPVFTPRSKSSILKPLLKLLEYEKNDIHQNTRETSCSKKIYRLVFLFVKCANLRM